ncbi:hypothetical protein FPD46_03830 [Campylobacter peloridis]|uniref:Plasmid replication protein RepL domain-containing protein n=1 Tax=Campylobacter peloridis TaxID=488546 RepID=A0A5C7DWC9_9BACT|nr:hypothetical protein [Campylobacter peloridis]TXE82925.1 hypothetical protein FPD46_03830 [Campylobacter peloridis]
MKKDIKILATRDHYFLDEESGVEQSKHDVIAKKFQSKQQFIKFFGENLVTLNKLTGNEIKFFVNCLSFMNYQNTIILNSDLRKDLKEILNISLPAISMHLKSLIEKEILIHLDPKKLSDEEKEYFKLTDRQSKMYLMNPKIVGKGSFKDLKEMRQILIKKFNFDKLEFEQQIVDERIYFDNDTKKNEYTVEKVIKSSDENTQNTMVIVDEKDKETKTNNKEILALNEEKKIESESIQPQKNDLTKDNNLLSLSKEVIELFNKEQKEHYNRMKKLEILMEAVQDKLIEENKLDDFQKVKDEFNKVTNEK